MEMIKLNEIENFKFEQIEETDGRFSITISKYTGNAKDVTVPESIGGIPVTKIGNWASSKKKKNYQV
jgi:hypothetical protein